MLSWSRNIWQIVFKVARCLFFRQAVRLLSSLSSCKREMVQDHLVSFLNTNTVRKYWHGGVSILKYLWLQHDILILLSNSPMNISHICRTELVIYLAPEIVEGKDSMFRKNKFIKFPRKKNVSINDVMFWSQGWY